MTMLGGCVLNAPDISSRTGNFSITIGGISCTIESSDARFLNLLRERYHNFETTGLGSYGILLNVVTREKLAMENTSQSFYPTVRRVSPDNYIMSQAFNPFVAVFNAASRKALVKMTEDHHCFDGFMRMFFTLILVEKKGLLLRASAIRDGDGSVSLGLSRNGKTNMPLSDDMVIIKPHNGGYRVYGTPFAGDFSARQSGGIYATLDKIYSLSEDSSNSPVSMDKTKAAKEIYECVAFFSDDSRLLNQMHDICQAVAGSVPVYELRFVSGHPLRQLVG